MQMNEQTLGTKPYVGLPPEPKFTDREWFQALEQFCRVFAIRPGERVVMLTDPLLDRRVVDAVSGLAKARGATLVQYMAESTSLPAVPDEVKPILEKADFVVSTWFCSIEDPFNVALRKRVRTILRRWARANRRSGRQADAGLAADACVRRSAGPAAARPAENQPARRGL